MKKLVLVLGVLLSLSVFALDSELPADVSAEEALSFELSHHHEVGRRFGRVECVAEDVGWEEHAGGHVAYGFFPELVRQRAIRECEQFHGSCTAYCQRF